MTELARVNSGWAKPVFNDGLTVPYRVYVAAQYYKSVTKVSNFDHCLTFAEMDNLLHEMLGYKNKRALNAFLNKTEGLDIFFSVNIKKQLIFLRGKKHISNFFNVHPGKTIGVELRYLKSNKAFRGALYRSTFKQRPTLQSRTIISDNTGVARSSQRTYEKAANIEKHFNMRAIPANLPQPEDGREALYTQVINNVRCYVYQTVNTYSNPDRVVLNNNKHFKLPAISGEHGESRESAGTSFVKFFVPSALYAERHYVAGMRSVKTISYNDTDVYVDTFYQCIRPTAPTLANVGY